MHNGPIFTLSSALFLLALPRLAHANESLPMARASFPILSESAEPPAERESSLDRLSPTVSGTLPPLPTPPRKASPPPAPPAAAPPPPAAPGDSTGWETSFVRRRPITRSLPARGGPDSADSAEASGSSRERDAWMLSVEGVTRAPVDAGFQVTFETPGGLRLFGGYGWVPSMYLGRIMGTAAAVSSDPVLAAMLESGFESGTAWRAGVGWRPFRSVGMYLDAGYARVSLQGGLDTAELSGVPGLAGSYAIDSSLGLGFVELGYQAKIAERVVLAVALGATKVFSAKTQATPSGGAADDPKIGDATGFVDEGLEKYGVLPTLTLRLGLDLI